MRGIYLQVLIVGLLATSIGIVPCCSQALELVWSKPSVLKDNQSISAMGAFSKENQSYVLFASQKKDQANLDFVLYSVDAEKKTENFLKNFTVQYGNSEIVSMAVDPKRLTVFLLSKKASGIDFFSIEESENVHPYAIDRLSLWPLFSNGHGALAFGLIDSDLGIVAAYQGPVGLSHMYEIDAENIKDINSPILWANKKKDILGLEYFYIGSQWFLLEVEKVSAKQRVFHLYKMKNDSDGCRTRTLLASIQAPKDIAIQDIAWIPESNLFYAHDDNQKFYQVQLRGLQNVTFCGEEGLCDGTVLNYAWPTSPSERMIQQRKFLSSEEPGIYVLKTQALGQADQYEKVFVSP
ncbi:MAG: hypothetical protein KDD52_03510 [Bdellovibrionales bacterium]|nr:hypothetical protein [Bdellovibrionales bacterium]